MCFSQSLLSMHFFGLGVGGIMWWDGVRSLVVKGWFFVNNVSGVFLRSN